MVLENIHSPVDVKRLTEKQTELLCIELRQFLIEQISRTGGHLASNLGAVELTVAIHRVFDTSTDRLVFDVGHQCYVHKALTGRRELFATLRQFGGLSGFPKPYESVHDAFVAGHASNSVSVALGMARARSQFSCNFFACAGIKVIDNTYFKSIEEGVKAALESKAQIVVVCASDDDYAEAAPKIKELLCGKAILVVAGAPACAPELEAQGITNFINVKSNVLETLKFYLKEMGI